MKYSRSRDATLTLRNLASAERRAPKRTDGDAGLSPPNERSGTQPTSPEKLRQLHAARRLFSESLSQPHVVLGTPIPTTQQSTRRFRALAPSPPVQPATHPTASRSDSSTVRSSTTSVDYSYLATRFRKVGKDSQDDPSAAGARVKLAAIQRDHCSRRRAGEAVSQTTSISQLGVLEGSGVLDKVTLCFRRSSLLGLTTESRCKSRSTTAERASRWGSVSQGNRRQKPLPRIRY
jgi:hypothetical protein